MLPYLGTGVLALLCSLYVIQASPSRRVKRDVPDCYIVEVLAFVDATVWDHWRTVTGNPADESVTTLALKAHYTSLYNEVDERLMSIDKVTSGICIRAYLVDVMISKTAAESSWSNANSGDPMEINGVNALVAFQGFHKANSGGRNYDYTQGFTRKKILFDQLYYKGLSYLSTTCQYDYSVSIVEDNDAHTPLASAQQIGHFLGSNHDSTIGCNDGDYYVMSSQLASVDAANIGNTFLYSSCSVNAFKNQVGKYNCLADHVSRITAAVWDNQDTSQDLGRLYDLNEQCRLLVAGSQGYCDVSYDPEDPTTWDNTLTPDMCTAGAFCKSPAGGCVQVDVFERTPCRRTQDATKITNYECYRGVCSWASEKVPPPPPPAPGPGIGG